MKFFGRIGRLSTSRLALADKVWSSGLFDADYYSHEVGIDFADANEALAHYLSVGDGLNANPHPLFSTKWYRQKAEIDLREIALVHYIENGHLGKEDPHPLFMSAWYLEKNKDVLKPGANPLSHYVTQGWIERCPVHPLFDDAWYRGTYPDIALYEYDSFAHYVRWGSDEGRNPSEFFDTAWYTRNYQFTGHALVHFLTEGAEKGFDPSSRFSTRWYTKVNGDVARSGLNPLIHYVDCGRAIGAMPAPVFKLDDKHSIDQKHFDEWRSMVVKKHLTPVQPYDSWLPLSLKGWQRPARKEARRSIRRLIVRVVSQVEERTVESLQAACRQHGFDLTFVREIPHDLADLDVPAETVLLVLQDGDLLDEIGLEALCASLLPSTRLCIFDMFFTAGGRSFPVLLPGFNPFHLKSIDCTFSRFAVRADELLRFRDEAGSDRALLLAVLDGIMAERDFDSLVHVPAPVVKVSDLTDEIIRSREKALVTSSPDLAGLGDAKVSVVICTKDKGLLLRQLLASLLGATTDALIADVSIVSNQTTNAFARRTLEEWSQHPKVNVLTYDQQFNFSAQSNLGATAGAGEFVLFLNDDIVPVTADWLHHLMAPFVDPEVGITGPLLVYPNEQAQHAGMYISNGTTHHTLRHARLPEQDYIFLGTCGRDVSMVTGAALLMRRSRFHDLNGFDVQLASIYQDVDLCLRISQLDLRILYVPHAILLHMESVTLLPMIEKVGSGTRVREIEYFRRQHGPKALAWDPFHNPNFLSEDAKLRSLQR